MNRSTDHDADSRHDDTRLREFLRRASPILAAERGWNEKSRLKIRSLALDMNLPTDLYDIAVERLQQGDLNFREGYSTYERAFIKYLRKQFAKSKNSVLTAAHETRAVRIARREYEIPQPRARQLIRNVAEQAGISRVSKLDAIEYVASIVDENIGSGTTLPDATRGRIYQASAKWGIDRAQVEILIENRLTANRQVLVPSTPGKTRIVAGLVAIIFVAALLFGLHYLVTQNEHLPDNKTDKPLPESSVAPGPESAQATWPDWFSITTIEKFNWFTKQLRAARFPHDLLKSVDPAKRLRGYRELVAVIGDGQDDFSSNGCQLFANFFADESPDICQKMLGDLQTLVPTNLTDQSNQLQKFARHYLAGRLISACLHQTEDPEKRELLNSATITICDRPLSKIANKDIRDTSVNLELLSNAIATRQWRMVGTLGYSDPEHVARMLDSIGTMARKHGVTECPMEAAVAFQLLTIRPGIWNRMKETLQRSIESVALDRLRELYLRASESGSPELKSWVGRKLADRFNIGTNRMTADRIDKTVREKLGLMESDRDDVQAIVGRLRDEANARRTMAIDNPASPVSIARAAHFATIAFLLNQFENTGDTRLLAKMEQLFDQPPPEFRVRSQPITSNPVIYGRIQRRALPSDIQTLNSALSALRSSDDDNEIRRALAIEKLARAAPRIRDINPADAQVVARFVVNARQTKELVAIEKHLPQLRHWATLCLALVDEMASENAPRDQTLTCAALLLDVPIENINFVDWQKQLRRIGLQKVADNLRHTAEIQQADQRFQWDELRQSLMRLYRMRCDAIGVSAANTSAARSPGELSELLLIHMPTQSKDHSLKQKLATSNRYVAQHDMAMFCMNGNCIAALMASEKQNQSSPVAIKPVRELATTENNNSLEQRLLANEMALLKLYLGDKP